MALVLGVVALLVMLTAAPALGGLVFAEGVAAYTSSAGSLLFQLREQPRNTCHGRVLAMATSGTALVGVVVIAVLG